MIATHQKSSEDIGDTRDYFGYSTDVFYRTDDFDGIQNMAANVQLGYKADMFNVNLEYRFRGMQASMLYLRENHDDGTFDLSSNLGLLNSQRIAFNGSVNPMEALKIDLGVTAEMALSEIKSTDDECKGWKSVAESGGWWYNRRFAEQDEPLFDRTGGAEFTFEPAVAYTIEDYGITIGAYGDLNYCAYQWSDGIDEDKANKYGESDSPFRFKKAGVSFGMTPDSDIVKGVNVYYGLDMSNKVRYFNTLVGQVMFPGDVTANLAIGIKTENTLSDGDVYKFDSDINNPFAFAVGVSKRFKAMKKPTLYAQFVYNMDPFKHFGDGQDQLNLDRSNVKGSWEKEGRGKIDAVDWYDGEAALRVGVRWDI